MNWKKTLLICFIILLAGGILTTIIFSTEPTAGRTGASQETAMLVDVTEVERGTFRPTIKTTGTVQPAQDITLTPRVSGEITERSQNFIPGGYVQKGEPLLKINPEDYQHTLQQRKSELRQAESDLTLEMGRQQAAQKEYQAYGDTLSEENKARVLRKPQLNSVKAQVQAAQTAVDQAELNLQRTTIRAPFDAHILNRNVNIGSQVSVGDNLGRLVGINEYWVEATVPLSKLRWVTVPGNNQEMGPEVRIRNRTAWPEGQYRTGHLYKVLGTLTDQTRQARVLITVSDPHGYQSKNKDLPRLMIGAFVEANIKANKLTDVIRLNRDYLRQDETVWVMEDNKLRIRDVKIAFQDAQYAYIDSGLTHNAQVVTTNLTTVSDGAPLRLEGTENTSQNKRTAE